MVSKNLTIGTTYLTDLIKVCADSGVREFILGDLSISFDEPREVVEDKIVTDTAHQTETPRVEMTQEERDELLLTNPFAWEQLSHKEA